MDSAISPEESTKLDDSKTLLFVLDTPLSSELWASEVRHYLEISANSAISADESTKTSDSFLYLTPPLGLELWSPEVTGDYL